MTHTTSTRRSILAAALLTLAAASQGFGALIHDYDLNGSFADNLGGPALAPVGGSINATNFSFGFNEGLTLSGAIPSGDNYSLLMDFSLSQLSGYRRLVDFKNNGSDTGLYNLNTAVNFYNIVTGAAGAFAPNTEVRMVITRDGVTDLFTAYLNGVQQISFVDSGDLAVFNQAGNIAKFFIDDTVFPNEASPGSVGKISIFDTALTAGQVAGLGGPGVAVVAAVPEPGSALVGMLALGVCGLGGARRRRN